MKSPTELLDRAKRLPNDEARRQLANDLRLEAREREFDERDAYFRLADQIDALCTTPDVAPPDAAQETEQSRIARVRTRLINALEDGDDLGPIIDKLKAMVGPPSTGRPSSSEQKVLAMLLGVKDSQPAHFKEAIDRVIRNVIPRRCASNPDNIKGVNIAIGNRGHDDGDKPDRDSVDGARPHIARRRTAFDKKPVFGDDADLDHMKAGNRPDQKTVETQARVAKKSGKFTKRPGQPSRNDAWKAMGLPGKPPRVRLLPDGQRRPRISPQQIRQLHMRLLQQENAPRKIVGASFAKSKRKSKAPHVPGTLLRSYSTGMSEKELYRTTKDYPKLAVTPREIRQKEEKAAAAAEEAAKAAEEKRIAAERHAAAIRTMRAEHARLGIPPLTDAQMRKIIGSGEVEHRDDPEF